MEPCRSLFGLEVYRSKYPSSSLNHGHWNGSFHPKANESASAAVCPDGYAYMARTPGRQGTYKAEVIGVLLDAHFSPPRTSLFTDNQGVSKVVTHTKQVLKEAYWVGLARAELTAKSSSLEWEKTHAEIRGNEIADEFSNRGTKLPLSHRAVIRLFCSRSSTLSAVRVAQKFPRGTWAMALPSCLGCLPLTTNHFPRLHSRVESPRAGVHWSKKRQNGTTTVSH